VGHQGVRRSSQDDQGVVRQRFFTCKKELCFYEYLFLSTLCHTKGTKIECLKETKKELKEDAL
jgi:hypothetical protein